MQALALAAILATGAVRIAAVRADVAADRGSGATVTVPAVATQAASPVTLGIPTLKLTNRLIGLRKNRDGTLQVPVDPARAGWYSEGPAPGDRGPAVIVGHVDDYRGPAVFARIGTLRKNDLIRVRRADGTLVTFAVQLVRTYSKRDFPTKLVYAGDNRPSLRLITCGGPFDPVSKRYLSNTVVFAGLVAARA